MATVKVTGACSYPCTQGGWPWWVSREVIRNTASGKHRARREKTDTKEHSREIPADEGATLKSLSP